MREGAVSRWGKTNVRLILSHADRPTGVSRRTGKVPGLTRLRAAHVARNGGVAQPVEHDEANGVSLIFLVGLHGSVQGVEGEGRWIGVHGDCADEVIGAVAGNGLGVALVGEEQACPHAYGHRLAVRERPVPGHRLDGVGERVPEVQNGPAARFPLVGTHDLGLNLDGPFDGFGDGVAVPARQDRHQVLFQILDELHVPDEGVLHDLGHAAGVLVHGECVERRRIRAHELWLVEGADQVLAGLVVDGRLAPHGSVDLGEEGGGQVHERKAAEEGGGGKPCEVADHAPAQRKDGCLPVDPPVQRRVVDPVEVLGRFGRLPGGEHEGFDRPAGVVEGFGEGGAVVGGHVPVAHEQTAPDAQAGFFKERRKRTERAEAHVVAPGAQVDVYGHWSVDDWQGSNV